MKGFDYRHRPHRHILCCVAALLLPFSINAEPSSAYLQCEKRLTDRGDQHLKKADKALRKSNERVEKLVQRELKNSSGIKSTEAEIRASVERVREWYRIGEARESFVEGTIKWQTGMDDDGPDFRCRRFDGVVATYKKFLRDYEFNLELFEEGVKERFALEDLRDDEGLVIIAFNSNQARSRVMINRRNAVGGNISFEPVGNGEHFRVYRAKAGTYNWDEIVQKIYSSRFLYDFSAHDLSFEVEAGKLNYSGVLMFNVNREMYYTATLEDRLTITLVVLEQRYPEFIRQYEIANGLYPDDRFTEFYLSEKGLINSASAANDDE